MFDATHVYYRTIAIQRSSSAITWGRKTVRCYHLSMNPANNIQSCCFFFIIFLLFVIRFCGLVWLIWINWTNTHSVEENNISYLNTVIITKPEWYSSPLQEQCPDSNERKEIWSECLIRFGSERPPQLWTKPFHTQRVNVLTHSLWAHLLMHICIFLKSPISIMVLVGGWITAIVR